MSDTSFSCTVLNIHNDSKTVTFNAGDVIRLGGTAPTSWSDCIILGFSRPDGHRDVYVKLARPYAYASCIGTTGPGVLMGCEEFLMSAKKLRYHSVVSDHPMVSGPVPNIHHDSEIIEMFE